MLDKNGTGPVKGGKGEDNTLRDRQIEKGSAQNAMRETTRVQFEITPERLQELEQLRQEGGLSTKKDVLNNALTLLKWAARERKRGNIIASLNETEGVYKELEMPFLDQVSCCSSESRRGGAAVPARINGAANIARKIQRSRVRAVTQGG